MTNKRIPSKKAPVSKPAATKAPSGPDTGKVSLKKAAAKGPAAPRTAAVKLTTAAKSRLGKTALAAARDLVSAHVSVGDRVTEIVQDWANAATEPASDAILSTLWANSGNASPFTVGAQDLTTRLHSDLGSKLRPSDIKNDTSLSDLIQMIV